MVISDGGRPGTAFCPPGMSTAPSLASAIAALRVSVRGRLSPAA